MDQLVEKLIALFRETKKGVLIDEWTINKALCKAKNQLLLEGAAELKKSGERVHTYADGNGKIHVCFLSCGHEHDPSKYDNKGFVPSRIP